MTLAQLLSQHQVLGLDSNVLIYLFEGSGSLADAAEAVIDAIDGGEASGVMASIGLTEILARPAIVGDGVLFERYADEIRAISGLRIMSLDAETAIDAAWGRSGGRDLGDAVHVATARRAGATCFVTNDRRIRGRSGVDIVLLEEITLDEPRSGH